MSKRNSFLILEDIVESCDKVFRYTDNIPFDDFINDEKTIDAVLRNFEVIGEATNILPIEILKLNPNIEWHQIISLRNRLIHTYFGVDYQIVWKILKEFLPTFKLQIEQILLENSKKQ